MPSRSPFRTWTTVRYGRPTRPPPGPPVIDEVPPLDIVRERFPRIAKAIELMWGTRELESYLGKLIITERENREGFPPDVLSALLRISRQHAQEFVFEDDTTGSDPFHQHAFRKR